jgi:uncharacterized C2H2 Zn-finger protein
LQQKVTQKPATEMKYSPQSKSEPLTPQKPFGITEEVTIKIDPAEIVNPNIFECSRCQQTFTSAKSIQVHNNKKHRRSSLNTKNSNKSKEFQKCQFCDSILTFNVFKIHQKRIETIGTCFRKVCPFCHEPLTKPMDKHIKEQHKIESTCCRFCDKKFDNWNICRKHVARQHKVQYAEWREQMKKDRKEFLESIDQKQVEEENQDYFHEVMVDNFKFS